MNFVIPKEVGLVLLPGFLRTNKWLHKAEVTMTGVGNDWSAGRMKQVIKIREEDPGKER